MTTPKEVLKPCAHCGGQAGVAYGKDYHFVNCTECMLSNNLICESVKLQKEDAVEDWNTRPRESELITTLKQAREALQKIGRDQPHDKRWQAIEAREALSRIEQVLGEKL